MNLLKRSIAPIPDAAWTALDEDTRQALTEHYVARRVVDFDGPHGLDFAAVNLGTLEPLELGDGVRAGLRSVQRLLEVRVQFSIARSTLEDAARGARAFDTDRALDAARRLAELEDRAVFYGVEAASIQGMIECSPYPAITLGEDPNNYADAVTRALIDLDDAAVAGPYALLLGSNPYRRLAARSTSYPPLQHLSKLLGGPVLHSRVLEGGLLVSLRGGDFQLSVGQDAALGFESYDAERVNLFLLESFTFLVLSPEAVVRLLP